MHEMGLAQQMLQAALDSAAQHKMVRVTCFKVEMSAAAGESAESLCFYLDILARGTLAEGARVEIAEVPAPDAPGERDHIDLVSIEGELGDKG